MARFPLRSQLHDLGIVSSRRRAKPYTSHELENMQACSFQRFRRFLVVVIKWISTVPPDAMLLVDWELEFGVDSVSVSSGIGEFSSSRRVSSCNAWFCGKLSS